jgi:site-specific DNA-methyltransferase (adenine-specific)
MRSLPDKYFDLCIADPPYGINAANMTMGSGKQKKWAKGKTWDSTIPNDDVFEELFRTCKELIIWGGNYFNLPLTKNWIVWDKLNPNLSFAEGELAWCSINKNLRIFKYYNVGGERIHPTQKPIALYSWILDKYAMGGG